MLAATASFINCVGGFDGDSPTEITRSDVDQVVKTLVSNNAYMIMDYIEGKLCALFKSSLIDFKFEVAYAVA